MNLFLKINMFLGIVAEQAEALPLIFYVYHKVYNTSKFKGSPLIRLIVVYSTFCYLLKVATNFWLLLGNNNLFFYAILGVVECLFLTYFYLRAIQIDKKMILILVIVILIINVIIVSSEKPKSFNSLLWTINLLWLSSLSIYYLYFRFKRISLNQEEKWPDSVFIINAGLILYFSASFFVYLLAWYFLTLRDQSLIANAWVLITIGTLIKALSITWAVHRSST